MKQLFNITWEEGTAAGETLICELSHYHICLATLSQNRLGRVVYYEKSSPITQSNLQDVLQKEGLNPKSFKSLLVGSAFPDCTLVPQTLVSEKDLDSFLHQKGNTFFTDALQERQINLVYTIPAYLLSVFQTEAALQTMHVHTAALQKQEQLAETYIALHFTSKEFQLLAVKEGQLQLAQIYPFTAPLDVVYYLLMISEQYQMPQSQTTLYLSGLLDDGSALYKELYQYYIQVQFQTHADFPLPPTDHQQHYFSSLLNLAACASLVAR